MTSDERRNVAEELRDLIDDDISRDDPRSNVPLDDVERAIGLYGGFYDGGTTADCVEQLANFIDPTCENEADVNPVDGFICSACGWPGVVQQAVDNGWQEYAFDEFVEYVPRYCPYCGSRLVRRNED